MSAVGIGRPDREQTVFFDLHRGRRIADGGVGVGGGGLADQCGGIFRFFLLDEVHFAGELIKPRFDRRPYFPGVLDLNRVVRRQLGQLLDIGDDIGNS